MSDAPQAAATCYRHPGRPAPLACTRCERPICLDDAIDAPVGYLCPECARQPRRVRQAQRAFGGGVPAVTRAVLAVVVVAYLAQQVSPEVTRAGWTWGPAIAAGEWWRLVTGAFLHSGLLHVGFNGYLLYALGNMLEPAMRSWRFAAVYAGGLFGGAAGIMLLGWAGPAIGASGAVFGLMGAAMVGLRRRGIDPFRSSIGGLVLLNLAFTFLVPRVSIGGHVGGLIGGALVGAIVFTLEGERQRTGGILAWLAVAALGVLSLVLAIVGPVLG